MNDIERIARAICVADIGRGFPSWKDLTPAEIDGYIDRAKWAYAAMNQWQDIETAPKGVAHKQFLLWGKFHQSDNVPFTRVIGWKSSERKDDGMWGVGCWYAHDHSGIKTFYPVLFSQLPPEPSK